MALQGTLETFALPDVLRLLASTKKTGQLRVTGSRGSGSIWLDGGAIVSSDASRAPLADGAVEVVFELLRFKEGDFVFDDDAQATDSGPGADVEDTLRDAESMLDEWKGIESVVPSLQAWVSLAPELPEDEVTLDATRWAQIVAVGGGTTVGGLGDALSQGELPASRTVKELLEQGLVTLGDVPASASAAATAPEPFEPAVSIEVAAFEVDTLVVEPEAPLLTVVDDPSPVDFSGGGAGPSDGDAFDPGDLVIEPPSYADADTAADFAAPAHALEPEPLPQDDELTDAAEIARQLANLSPKAAKAVAAAAKATTQEEREAALAEVDDDEEPINRGLLLKFLGSVNG